MKKSLLKAISVLKIEPGDVLLIKMAQFDQDEYNLIERCLGQALPFSVKSIFYDDRIKSIKVIRAKNA